MKLFYDSMPLSSVITGMKNGYQTQFNHFHPVILDRMCLRPLLAAPSERSRDATLLFDQQLFLQHIPVAEWQFFRQLFDTQLFCVFVEQRSFVHAESTALAFFDECTEKV